MYIGVREQHKGRFRARISVDYKIICLGSYDRPKDAALARDNYVLANKLNRKLNFPDRAGQA